MQTPLEITFRGMETSPAVDAEIQRQVGKLEQSHKLQRCSVTVELPHRHHRHGQTFHVRIDVSVPAHTFTVSRDPGLDHGHEDIYVALADAFRAARRQLDDHAQIRRGDVKHHATAP